MPTSRKICGNSFQKLRAKWRGLAWFLSVQPVSDCRGPEHGAQANLRPQGMAVPESKQGHGCPCLCSRAKARATGKRVGSKPETLHEPKVSLRACTSTGPDLRSTLQPHQQDHSAPAQICENLQRFVPHTGVHTSRLYGKVTAIFAVIFTLICAKVVSACKRAGCGEKRVDIRHVMRRWYRGIGVHRTGAC